VPLLPPPAHPSGTSASSLRSLSNSSVRNAPCDPAISRRLPLPCLTLPLTPALDAWAGTAAGRAGLSRPTCGRASPSSFSLWSRHVPAWAASAAPRAVTHRRSPLALVRRVPAGLASAAPGAVAHRRPPLAGGCAFRDHLPGCLSRPTYGRASPFPSPPVDLPYGPFAGSLAGLPQPPQVRSRMAVLLSLIRVPFVVTCRAASAAPRAIAHRRSPLWSPVVRLAVSPAGLPQPPHVRSRIAVLLSGLVVFCGRLPCRAASVTPVDARE
jgi:hypothetical protein